MAFLGSYNLNFSNRPVRTRMPGGVAGAQLNAAPYADQETVWIHCRERLVFAAALEKFRQNPDLADILLKTGHDLLAEASKYDLIWGTGLDENDPRIALAAQWPGQNLLVRVSLNNHA